MAHSTDTADSAGLKLPVGVVGAGDLRRLSRQLKQLEETLEQIRLRTNAPVAKLPRATRSLEEFASTNRLNLLLPADRQKMAAFIEATLRSAPVLHMSFAAEASRAFTTEVVLWLRSNIHPNVLLEIGLEPAIAAGCILRTPNRQYDFSLRSRFEAQSKSLVEKLHGAAAGPELAKPPAVRAEPQGTARVGQ